MNQHCISGRRARRQRSIQSRLPDGTGVLPRGGPCRNACRTRLQRRGPRRSRTASACEQGPAPMQAVHHLGRDHRLDAGPDLDAAEACDGCRVSRSSSAAITAFRLARSPEWPLTPESTHGHLFVLVARRPQRFPHADDHPLGQSARHAGCLSRRACRLRGLPSRSQTRCRPTASACSGSARSIPTSARRCAATASRPSTCAKLDERGFVAPLSAFLDQVRAADGLLHVSLDVDFLDPSIAPAVGTTVPGGATFREAHLVMEMLHDSGLGHIARPGRAEPVPRRTRPHRALMVDLTASLMGRRVFDRAQPASHPSSPSETDPMPPAFDLAYVPFVSVENMMRLVHHIGVERVLKDLAEEIEPISPLAAFRQGAAARQAIRRSA
jgi:hypothetical protein